jgi:ligand-binding SRPBCC domain-containing protein
MQVAFRAGAGIAAPNSSFFRFLVRAGPTLGPHNGALMPTVRLSTLFLAPAHHVWDAATEPRSLNRFDSEASLRLLPSQRLRKGSRLQWLVGEGHPRFACEVEVRQFDSGRGFLAERVRGSIPQFTHVRRLDVRGETALLEDRIEYSAPGGPLAAWVDRKFVRDGLLHLLQQTHRTAAGLAACKTTEPEGEWVPRHDWGEPVAGWWQERAR